MKPAHKVLIAGDGNLRKNLAEQFAAAPEFAVLEVETLGEAIELAAAKTPTALLIDEDLAGPDPRPVIERLRTRRFAGPILLLAAKKQDLATNLAECVVRPFRFADLLKRLLTLLRRQEKSGGDERLLIGPYVFHPDSGDLSKPGSENVRLTETESAILMRLARAGGASVSRKILLRDVWGYNPSVATRTLETHIFRIRRKIEAAPVRPSILVTEAGGYRLAVKANSSKPRSG
jgi:DNA-binding response OmpR family regulator